MRNLPRRWNAGLFSGIPAGWQRWNPSGIGPGGPPHVGKFSFGDATHTPPSGKGRLGVYFSGLWGFIRLVGKRSV